MHLKSQIRAAIEMLNLFFISQSPFDIIMAKFFRNHKWIGSSDRKNIAEFVYSIFRNFEKLKFLTSDITSDHGRFFVLVFLKIHHQMQTEQIEELFCADKSYNSPVTPFEKKFIENLDVNQKFPNYVLLNYPQWLDAYFKKAFSSHDYEKEIMALNGRALVDLRVNLLKSDKATVRKMLMNSDFKVEDCEFSDIGLRIDQRISRNHEIISQGFAEIQDEGSQMIAIACDAKAGDTVVDFCAGAGGKTLALAAIMQNKGRIFALDKYAERLENAKIRLRRAGASNVFCHDISGKWIKRHLQCADIVLVDAPCSGTGTWRRNPDMRAKFSAQDLAELLLVQADILENACKLVKKGGKLVYATCSILLEENEEQIENFLKQFDDFKLKPISLQKYSGNYLKLSPHRNNTDGFFAAVLEKTS